MRSALSFRLSHPASGVLFDGNRRNRQNQKQQLQYGISQLEEELKGLVAQHAAKADELDLVRSRT